MSLKFQFLESRVTELEKHVRDMHEVIKILLKKTKTEAIEKKELLSIPPVDPDLRNTFEKKY